MKINNFGYLMKEGIRGIFLHGFMSFAAVIVTVACLLIVGCFFCLTYNINILVANLNKTNEILVIVDETLSDAEARSIGTDINRVANVSEATFISREEAMEKFLATHDDKGAFEGVDASFFRHRFSVILEDNRLQEDTIKAVSTIPGVVKVKADTELAQGFSMLQDVISVISLVLIGVLVIISFLIISNTVKLAMYDRKTEIAIMKMVGATNGFIRLPFVVQGMILGLLGAGIAFGLQWLAYDALVARIATLDSFNLFTLVPFSELLIPTVVVFGAAGLFVGIAGSWTSIRRFMDV